MPAKPSTTLAALMLTLLICGETACQTEGQDRYNEANYKEISRGTWKEYFAITYRSERDTNYFFRKLYPDSTYNDSLYDKYFFYKDIMEGPVEQYWDGVLSQKGYRKANQRHGEQLHFNTEGKLVQCAFYHEGLKAGTWEHFDSQGRLYKKVYYDKDGAFIKQEIFDRQGKLVRTEMQESRGY